MKVSMLWEDDCMDGLDGFQIIGHPVEDYSYSENDHILSPRMVAHDIVEHVNGWQNIGTVEDELEALGTAWYTRGQWNTDITDAGLRNDVITNLMYVTRRKLEDHGINLETAACPYAFDWIEENLIQGCIDNWGEEENMSITEHNVSMVKGWMLSGVRKAEKKYGRYSRFCANNLFTNMRQTLADFYSDWPREYFDLHYVISTQKVWIKRRPEYDYY